MQLHNVHLEGKITPETIPVYREFIRNAPIEHLKELTTTLKSNRKKPATS